MRQLTMVEGLTLTLLVGAVLGLMVLAVLSPLEAIAFLFGTSIAGVVGYYRKPPEECVDEREAAMDAWGVIANAYGGNWESAPAEWVEAARRFHEEYLA